ncbi:MAG: ABC transporter permease subunit [Anaerolineales bacterium]|nr:ABC transporter permease subunit [Anaerolineales bacterium]
MSLSNKEILEREARRKKRTQIALPTVFLLFLFLFWEFVIGDSLQFVLPKPSLIIRQIVVIAPIIWRGAKVTILEAFTGLLIGTTIGILVAIGFVYNRTFAKTVYPYALILRSLPLLALLPILTGLMGPGFSSKITIIAFSTFFPILINMVQGFTSVNATSVELMHSLNASRKEIFLKVRLPWALPYLFIALKIAGSGAILAAIISEYMYAIEGLGALMVSLMFSGRVADLWAAMFASAGLSLLVYGLILLMERWLVPWGKYVKES